MSGKYLRTRLSVLGRTTVAASAGGIGLAPEDFPRPQRYCSGVKSLQAQIDAVPAGGALELPPGLLELDGPLVLRQSIALSGSGTTLQLSTGRDAVLRLQGAGPFWLRGLRIVYAGAGPARGVWIESGEAHLEECHISGACWVDDRGLGCGIHFSGEARGSVVFCEIFANDVGIVLDHQCNAQLESNRCYENRLHGMQLQGYARVKASQNECRDNGETGVWVTGNASAEFDGNRCHSNGTHGFLLGSHSQSRLQGNEASRNGHHGVSVEQTAGANLDAQVCEENGLCGIDLGGECKVQAHGNFCTENTWHGIQVRDRAWPVLQANRCRNNGHSGLAYYGEAGGCARDGWLEENTEYAVQVSDRAAPLLRANRCSRNGLSGLAYFGDASGLAQQNHATGHAYHGLQTSDSAQPLLEGNRCSQNSLFGFACFGVSKPILRGNEALQNGQGGYYVGDQAEPQLWDNQATENGACGMQIVGRSGGYFVDNHLSANGNYGLQIGPDASPWLGANTSQGHAVSDVHCLSTQAILLEKARSSGKRLEQGHRLQLVDGEGQSLDIVLPFEPKPPERLVLEALAKHGKLSESELSKIAKTRRISGLLEALQEKLNRAGLPYLENQGQGSEGTIYAFRR